MIRCLPHIAITAFCAASLYQIHAPPSPRLIYNSSASAPTGWYRLHTDGDVKRGSLVAAFAPEKARKLAHDRGYLPEHVPLIKTVWAIGGERICIKTGGFQPKIVLIFTPARRMILGESCLKSKDASRLKQTKSSSCPLMCRPHGTAAILALSRFRMFWEQWNIWELSRSLWLIGGLGTGEGRGGQDKSK